MSDNGKPPEGLFPDMDLPPPPAKKKKNKGGRPYKVPPSPELSAQVRTMAACGLTQEEIGLCLGLTRQQIRNRFKAELAQGHPLAVAKVAASLYKVATKGTGSAQVQAAIFWLKTRARWSTTERIELGVGSSGTVLDHPKLADLRDLTPDELRDLERLARRLEAIGAEKREPAPDSSQNGSGPSPRWN